MSKIIAVWGSPNSGKTTFATKLARSIYDNYQSTVIVVYTDMETPTLPIIFPNEKKENLFSVGVPLSKTEITAETVTPQIITVKDKSNLGFVGFTDGENRFTYPSFDESKARSLFDVFSSLANYVIVDCTSIPNALGITALKTADEVIRLAATDLKSIGFFASQLPLYADPSFLIERQVQGINVPDESLFMPIEDVRAHIENVRFTLPYSREVRQQMLDGNLFQAVIDRKFNKKLKSIAERVI